MRRLSRKIFTLAVISICCISAISFTFYSKQSAITGIISTNTLSQTISVSDDTISTGRSLDDVDHTQAVEITSSPRRKGLIIVAHGKSGSSFTLDIFDKNELIFAVYEPLVLAEWWKQRDRAAGLAFNHTEAVLDLISSFMTCSFSSQYALRFLKEYSQEWNRRGYSTVLMSPPFCATARERDTCVDLDPNLVEEECRKKDYSVIKVMYNRLPSRSIGIFESAIERLMGQVDVKVAHLVRDPRGVINSRINLGWIKDYPDEHLAMKVQKVSVDIMPIARLRGGKPELGDTKSQKKKHLSVHGE